MIVSPNMPLAVMHSQNGRHNNAYNKGISVGCRLKRAQSSTYTILSPWETTNLYDLENRSKQLLFLVGLQIFWFCYIREGKNCLVMHDVSTIDTFFFLLSFTSFFPFLCSFTFNSLFKFHRLLCCSLMVLFLFISQHKSMCFPLFIFVLHQLPLSAEDTYHARRWPTTFWLYVNGFNQSHYFFDHEQGSTTHSTTSSFLF